MTISEIDHEVRADVADVLVRYATGIDRRDWELFRTCFTEDCDADYGDIGLARCRGAHHLDARDPCRVWSDAAPDLQRRSVEPHEDGVAPGATSTP